MYVTQNILIINLEPDVTPEGARRRTFDVLMRMRASGLHRVVLDASALRVVDSVAVEEIAALVSAIRIAGGVAVLAGITPEAAATIVELDGPPIEAKAARSIDAAMAVLTAHGRG